MHHRRTHSDSSIDIKVRNLVGDADDDESVSDSESSVHTVDLYRGWSLPDLNFSVKLPGWFVMLVTLFIFRG
jgi:hypothetical protein